LALKEFDLSLSGNVTPSFAVSNGNAGQFIFRQGTAPCCTVLDINNAGNVPSVKVA
jgi:hypothetical protein